MPNGDENGNGNGSSRWNGKYGTEETSRRGSYANTGGMLPTWLTTPLNKPGEGHIGRVPRPGFGILGRPEKEKE